ncbi:GNAT family N-acetyltransferase [Macrococcus lamae]|uniref:N-acetyltransferase n=1 Tax=Macrococcus lamae TaxID=198484 RepID=A0A4R6BTJ2_9STAP|nr:GNAT family protein [Macrococcus lamae]TDM07939.1 N-acetyltransferase [Macrococcus lamae]
MTIFETERLMIRRPVSSDFDNFITIRNSEPFLNYNPMPELTEDAAREELEHLIKEETMYAICLKDDTMIGMMDAFHDSLRYNVNSQMISYNMNEAFTGKGYMQEALVGLISHLFENGTDIISARVFKGNVASKHLLEKVGFIHEGTLRHCVKGNHDIIHDDWIFSLMKEDWTISDDHSSLLKEQQHEIS